MIESGEHQSLPENCAPGALRLGSHLTAGLGHLGVAYGSGLTSCFLDETFRKAFSLDLLFPTFVA